MNLSAAFDVLRLPLLLLVVFIHADNRTLFWQGISQTLHPQGKIALGIRLVVSQELARVAVPLMFAIAGYLFFLRFSGTREELLRKWKSRFATLLIPFLAWGLVHYIVLGISVGKVPFDHSIWEGLNSILGITRAPQAFHLWFIRDLIVFVFVIPLLFARSNYGLIVATLVAFAVYFSSTWPLPRPSIEGLSFFILGALLGKRNWQGAGVLDRRLIWGTLYCALLVADTYLGAVPFSLVHKLALLAGCGAFLSLAATLSERLPKWARWLSALAPASFFLYAAHEPLLRICRSALYQIMPQGIDPGTYLLYVLPSVIVSTALIATYFTVIRRVTLLRKIFAGGR